MRLAKAGDTIEITYTAGLADLKEGGRYKVGYVSRGAPYEVYMTLEGLIGYWYASEERACTYNHLPRFKVVANKWWQE